MTLVTRFDPFREMANLQAHLNRVLNEPYSSAEARESLAAGSFQPPVDIYEDEQAIQIKLEAPGVDEKDIDIRVENNLLTIRGERKMESELKQENFHRVERLFGQFTRSFTLPSTVDAEQVKASYDKGVLTVRLGKKAEAKPRQIKIDVQSALKQ